MQEFSHCKGLNSLSTKKSVLVAREESGPDLPSWIAYTASGVVLECLEEDDQCRPVFGIKIESKLVSGDIFGSFGSKELLEALDCTVVEVRGSSRNAAEAWNTIEARSTDVAFRRQRVGTNELSFNWLVGRIERRNMTS